MALEVVCLASALPLLDAFICWLPERQQAEGNSMTEVDAASAGWPATDVVADAIPAGARPDNLGALVASCQAQGWTPDQLAARLAARQLVGKGPAYVAKVLRSWAHDGPAQGDQPGVGYGEGRQRTSSCPVPGPANCGKPGCQGLLPGEVTDCPYPLLSERQAGESPAQHVSRISALAQQAAAVRRAAVQASPAARDLFHDQLGMDPGSWSGGIPQAWAPGPHGWVPAERSQLRMRQVLLQCVGVALADPDAQH